MSVVCLGEGEEWRGGRGEGGVACVCVGAWVRVRVGAGVVVWSWCVCGVVGCGGKVGARVGVCKCVCGVGACVAWVRVWACVGVRRRVLACVGLC